MDLLSLDHLGKPANPYMASTTRFVISKIFRPSDFGFKVTMERPSGDPVWRKHAHRSGERGQGRLSWLTTRPGHIPCSFHCDFDYRSSRWSVLRYELLDLRLHNHFAVDSRAGYPNLH